ncbi:hypothetical protein [Singulisphaera acidiphila]|uniref:Uncharacterized protein n=1 Tax=Singulisphaera acidiphila (strain ATCC BAA-1392 / DSM 18658 / VKM B-2454 / MOB10) TaxID=886293 RepID=L0DGP6_SINAD|nr:hypothetical protein [Singulisphaera acidiphila]AGA28432.1 hypothetical protein Sinac_4229 [Singulisphaera acidiphila DSM 18658]
MNRRKIIVVVAAGFLLASGYWVASAASKRRTASRARGWVAESTLIPDPERLAEFQGLNHPARLYTVEPEPVRGKVKARTPEEDQRFREAATIVARARPLPPDRLQYFSWVDREDSPLRIQGWSAFVHQVSPLPGGWAITLKVWPKATRKGGVGVLVYSTYFEEYTWTQADGVLDYVKGVGDPVIPDPSYGR